MTSGSDIFVVYSSDLSTDDRQHVEAQIWVAYSQDGGATFEKALVARGRTVHYNGAAVAVGPDPRRRGGRRVHVVWGEDRTEGAGKILSASASLGRKLGGFSAASAVSGGILANTYARSIAADAAGGVHVVFSGSDGRGEGVWYSRSGDGGATFPEVATLLGRYPGDPCIASDAGGDLFVVAAAGPGLAYWRRLAKVARWSFPVVIPGITADIASIAAQDADHVYLTGNVSGQVGVASTVNGGLEPGDWSVRVAVPQAGRDPKALAVDATGAVGIAWLGGEARPPTVYFARTTDGGNTWSSPAAAMVFPGQEDVRDVNMTLGPGGKALIAMSRNWNVVLANEK